MYAMKYYFDILHRSPTSYVCANAMFYYRLLSTYNLCINVGDTSSSNIDIKYFVSGHRYNICVLDFGVIEKRRKNCMAVVPEELEHVVWSARVNNSFTVVDFVHFAVEAKYYIYTRKRQITKASWTTITNDRLFLIQTVSCFGFTEEPVCDLQSS